MRKTAEREAGNAVAEACELHPAGGDAVEPADLAHHRADPALPQRRFHRGEHTGIVARLGEHEPGRIKAEGAQARRIEVIPRRDPQHRPPRREAGQQGGGEPGGERARLSLDSRRLHLMQLTERQAAAG